MKEIKTRSNTKDIKKLNKSTDISSRVKKIYIRTKEQPEQPEQPQQTGDNSYVDYATDKVKYGTDTTIRKTGNTVKNEGRRTIWKIKERRVTYKGKFYNGILTDDPSNQAIAKEKAKRKIMFTKQKEFGERRYYWRNKTEKHAQAGIIDERQPMQSVQNPIHGLSEKAVLPSIHPNTGSSGLAIKQSNGIGEKTIREVNGRTIKSAQKMVKTAETNTKAVIKTSQVSAQSSVKASQKAVQMIKVNSRSAAAGARTVKKALTVAFKEIIATSRGLIALISGGWTVIAIILVVCLAGLLLNSSFGIFFSNEKTGEDMPVMSEVVSGLNEEFIAEIEQIENNTPYDKLDLSNNANSGMVSNWRDILAVYAVKVAADPGNAMEVATLDDEKIEILRSIFWDMNVIDYKVEKIEQDGNDSSTKTILHIEVKSKTYSDMVGEYNFNLEQIKMLNELMKNEYQKLFITLTNYTLKL